jgi:hypothetical protein
MREWTLKFIRELLVRFLHEDLSSSQAAGDETNERNDMDSSVRSGVGGVTRLFFCSDEHVSRARIHKQVDRQIELRNFVSKTPPEPRYDRVVDKTIWIISIPSSEAIFERPFSRQKRIMRHSRVNSHRDLFRERFQLKGGRSESKHRLLNRLTRVLLTATKN